jgi:hypothetical protein
VPLAGDRKTTHHRITDRRLRCDSDVMCTLFGHLRRSWPDDAVIRAITCISGFFSTASATSNSSLGLDSHFLDLVATWILSQLGNGNFVLVGIPVSNQTAPLVLNAATWLVSHLPGSEHTIDVLVCPHWLQASERGI